MPKPRTSIAWTIDYTLLNEIVNTSNSIVEILQKLGLNGYNGNHRTLKARCLQDNIDLESVKKRSYASRMGNLYASNKLDEALIFCENSQYGSRRQIKKYLFRKGWENKCSCCGTDAEWMGKPLTLQLEHKNGINNDNREENLCLLCPNCHSQTSTFGGRNVTKKSGADSQD